MKSLTTHSAAWGMALAALSLLPMLAATAYAQPAAPSPAGTFALNDSAPLAMPAGDKQIAGVVHDEQGKPVAGLTVSLTWHWPEVSKDGVIRPGSTTLKGVQTDAQGHFAFSGLPPGNYDYVVLLLNQDGAPTEPGPYAPLPGPLVIAPTDSQKSLNLVVSVGSLVSGRVVEGQTGKPMAGVFAGAGPIPPGGDLAQWTFWDMPSEAVTDAQGYYQVRVLPGDVFVGVGRFDNGTLLTKRIRFAVQRVSVMKEQTAAAPDLTVSLHPVIVCLGPDGQPVANTPVRIAPDNLGTPGAYLLQDTTDSTGAVVLDRFENGSFSILQGSQTASGTFHLAPGQTLTVTMNGQTRSYPDGVATVRLMNDSAGILTGTVLSTDGSPIAKARVHVVQISSNSAVADFDFRTDATGIFHATLDPNGQYDVHVRADGFNQVAVKQGGSPLVNGTSANLGVIRLVRADGVVSGRVVDSAGKPMSGILVYVQGDRTNLSANVTDDQGRFRIPNVVTGEMLTLNLCLVGQLPDSGQVLIQSNEEMNLPKIEASPTEREIVWNPHT